MPREVDRCPDVGVLRPLVATGEQDNQGASTLDKVDPVAGSPVDPQFPHALAHETRVTRVAERQAPDARVDPCTCLSVSEGAEPTREFVGLANVDLHRILWDT